MKKKQKSENGIPQESENSHTTGLLNLSDDVLLMIMSHLNHIDLISLGLTCERFNSVFQDRTLWVNVDLRAKPLKRVDLMDCLCYFKQTTKSIATRGRANYGSKPTGHSSLFPLAFLQIISQSCPRLETLILEQFIIQGSEVKISDFPRNLTHLAIKSCPVFSLPKDYSYFHQIQYLLPQLKILNLSYNSWFDGHSLMALSQLPNLEELNLRGCHNLQGCVAYFSLAARFGFKKLKILDMRDTFIRDSEVCCFDRSPSLTHLYLEHPRVAPKSHRSLVVDDSDDDAPTHKRKRRKYGPDSDNYGSVIVVGLTNVAPGEPCFQLVPVNQNENGLPYLRLNGDRAVKIAFCNRTVNITYDPGNSQDREEQPPVSKADTKNKEEPSTSRNREEKEKRDYSSQSKQRNSKTLTNDELQSSNSKDYSKPGPSGENKTSKENLQCSVSNNKSNKIRNEPGPSWLPQNSDETIVFNNNNNNNNNKKKERKLLDEDNQPGPSGEQKISLKRKYETLNRIIKTDALSDSDTDFMTSDDEDLNFPEQHSWYYPPYPNDIEHDDCLLVSDLSIINFCPLLNPDEDDQNNRLFFIRICAGPDIKRENQCKLHTLTLRHFKGISDRSLVHLARVESLRYLDVTGTSVTKQGVSRFMQVRPEVEIIYGFSEDNQQKCNTN